MFLLIKTNARILDLRPVSDFHHVLVAVYPSKGMTRNTLTNMLGLTAGSVT